MDDLLLLVAVRPMASSMHVFQLLALFLVVLLDDFELFLAAFRHLVKRFVKVGVVLVVKDVVLKQWKLDLEDLPPCPEKNHVSGWMVMLDLCVVIESDHSVLSAVQQENCGQDDWIINTQLLRQLSHTLPLELRVIIWYQ